MALFLVPHGSFFAPCGALLTHMDVTDQYAAYSHQVGTLRNSFA